MDNRLFTLKLNTSLSQFEDGWDSYEWQAILVPQFKDFTLREGLSLKPMAVNLTDVPAVGEDDSGSSHYGGVLVFKCSGTLTLAGGHINLLGCGFQTVNDTFRPVTPQEGSGTLDTDEQSGCENSILKDRLLINVGDGACVILANAISVTNAASRIGNPTTSGVQYCRGASDSYNLPSGVSNIGGSNIVIVSTLWENFSPAIIAKYHTVDQWATRGLAGAYIACKNAYNQIIPDEGLYALDCLKNLTRVKEFLNISGFGTGKIGNYSYTTPKRVFNSYAKVTAISGKLYTLSIKSSSDNPLATFEVGTLVMIHQTRKSSGSDYKDGRFKLTRITAVSGSTVTVKHNFSWDLSTYNVQMVTIPEYNNMSLAAEYKLTPRYENGCGGICAFAVMGNCNISDAVFNVESKGTFNSVVNPIISNYSMKCALPLGQGHGSVFVLARNITMNTNTRFGGTFPGNIFAGRGGRDTGSIPRGGFRGQNGQSEDGTIIPQGGWGGGAGLKTSTDGVDRSICTGGWHSNAVAISDARDNGTPYGCQGAHVMIVANSINGLCLHALSTGGSAGYKHKGNYGQESGGCGYGGGGKIISIGHGSAGAGGYRGGGAGRDFKYKIAYPENWGAVVHAGGGGAGACFVYCNTVTNQNTAGLVLK